MNILMARFMSVGSELFSKSLKITDIMLIYKLNKKRFFGVAVNPFINVSMNNPTNHLIIDLILYLIHF